MYAIGLHCGEVYRCNFESWNKSQAAAASMKFRLALFSLVNIRILLVSNDLQLQDDAQAGTRWKVLTGVLLRL